MTIYHARSVRKPVTPDAAPLAAVMWIDAAAPIRAATGDSFVRDASIVTCVTFAPAAPGEEVALTVPLTQPAIAARGLATTTSPLPAGSRPSV